jgi:hypothetical protein
VSWPRLSIMVDERAMLFIEHILLLLLSMYYNFLLLPISIAIVASIGFVIDLKVLWMWRVNRCFDLGASCEAESDFV